MRVLLLLTFLLRPLVSATAEPGLLQTGDVSRGDLVRIPVTLPAGQLAEFSLSQRDIDLRLAIRTPSGELLPEMDGMAWGSETAALLVPQGGSYQVEIAGAKRGPARGRYALRVRCRRPAPKDAHLLAAQASLVAGIAKARERTAQSLAEAEALLQEAARPAQPTQGSRVAAIALLWLGRVLHWTGRYERADLATAHSERLWRAIKDERGETEAQRERALLLGQLGRLTATVPAHRALLARWRALGDRRGQAAAWYGLSRSYLQLKQHDQALRCGERTLSLQRQLGDSDAEVMLLSLLGELHTLRREYAKALDRYRALIPLVLTRNGDWENLHHFTGYAAALAWAGQLVQARVYRERVLMEYQRRADHAGVFHQHLALGELEFARGDYPRALWHAEAARQAADLVRNSGSRAALRPLIGHRRADGFLRARSLLRLHALHPEAGHLAAAFEAFDGSLGRFLLNSASAESHPTVGDVQRELLDDDTVLLEYSYVPGGVQQGWVVTRSGLHSFPIPPAYDLESLARRAHEALSAPGHWVPGETADRRASRLQRAQAQFQPLAARLSDALLQPVAHHLRRRILVVTHGSLQFLPVAALPDPETGRPMLERHEVVHVPSALAQVALQRARAGRSAPRLLMAVLADPVFDPSDDRLPSSLNWPTLPEETRSMLRTLSRAGRLPRLPFSHREARRVLAATPPGQGLALLGTAASRDALFSDRLQQYRILHVATHGVLNESEPERSGLVLSLFDGKGHPQPGFVRLEEIMAHRFQADLVVLSACDTALGRELATESALGFTGGFLAAGAGSVLAAAWKVDDEATAEFMGLFYRHLLGPARSTPAAAVRAAQRAFAQHPRWRNPYYWAGFLLTGQAAALVWDGR